MILIKTIMEFPLTTYWIIILFSRNYSLQKNYRNSPDDGPNSSITDFPDGNSVSQNQMTYRNSSFEMSPSLFLSMIIIVAGMRNSFGRSRLIPCLRHCLNKSLICFIVLFTDCMRTYCSQIA